MSTDQKVAASPPVRVDIRLDGRIRFSALVYDVQLKQDDDAVSFSAAMQPTMVSAPPPRVKETFGEDPRDGTEVILQAHSGRRDTVAPTKPRKRAAT